MSEENKCNGLDCAICAETKCPNEEKEKIIDGIDVSEEIRYCNNCSNLGLDFKTGKFYCGLSNRKDELPEILSCENFSSNYYIKRLQEENEGLKSLNDFNVQKIEVLKEEKDGMQIVINNYIEHTTKYRQALEEIREIAKYSIMHNSELNSNYQIILQNINEVFGNE